MLCCSGNISSEKNRMYLPTHFQQEDLTELFDCIEAHPLASVMVVHEGEIEANHIPLELDRSAGQKGDCFVDILPKQIQLFNLLETWRSAYVNFSGMQAYISPNWYEGKQRSITGVVPTWNYRVVHVKGKIRKIADEKYLRGILARLTGTHEATQPVPSENG